MAQPGRAAAGVLETTMTGEGPSAGAASPSGYVNPMEVGPRMRLPMAALWAAIGAATVVSGAGAAILAAVKPSAVWSALPGWGAVVGGFALAMVSLRPWKARPVGRLLMVWLGGRGICFVAVLALGAVLYSVPQSRPDPLAMGLVLAASYFAALLAEAFVMSRRLRAAGAARAEVGPPRGSDSRGE